MTEEPKTGRGVAISLAVADEIMSTCRRIRAIGDLMVRIGDHDDEMPQPAVLGEMLYDWADSIYDHLRTPPPASAVGVGEARDAANDDEAD